MKSWRRVLFVTLVLVITTLNRETRSQFFDDYGFPPDKQPFDRTTSLPPTTTEESVAYTDAVVETVTFTDGIPESETEVPESVETDVRIIPPDDDDEGHEEVVINELERPTGLVVVSSTQRSITFKWNFNPVAGRVEGYRISYARDNFRAVQTLTNPDALEYQLVGLEPYTTYKIWIEGIVDGRKTPSSEPILANTDVDQPSPPGLLNATCFDTGQIYVEWKRPDRFDKSVDYYKLYHKTVSEPTYKSVTIQANAKDDNLSHVIDNLSGNVEYVVKICAGTKSLSNPNKTWLGEPSEERVVYLPEDKCELGILAPKMAAEYSAGIIAGAGCALLLILLSVICFLTRRKRIKQQQFLVDKIQSQPSIAPPELFNWEEKFGPEWSSESIPLEIFPDHVSQLHKDGDNLFSKEYEEIQKYSRKIAKGFTHEHSSNPENKCKNRYLNIVAYDHSRVRLLPQKKPCSDYINANFIDSFRQSNAYIGTQGPLEHTFEAFWRMVWEQNVHVIVMITNLKESERKKCDRYWPKEESETYGAFEATLTREEVMANYTVRNIRLKQTKTKIQREIHQFHYTSWPDHGVPSHPLPVLTYIRKSLEANPADGGPIVVHCSAGVGRTGTYIAIDSMLQQIQFKKELNVFGFLKHIRGQRNYLVQTEDQYIFLHDALLEAIQSGNTEIPRDQLAEYILKLVSQDQNTDANQRPIDKQYQLATSFKPSDFQCMSGNAKYNKNKNRNPDLLPLEGSRVPLVPKPGVEGSDYINASWFHGHNKLKEFIVCQHPMDKAEEDFWRMLWDHSAQTVVLLSAVDDQEYPSFWPSRNSDFNFETFRVRFVEESSHAGHTTYDFAVSSNHDDYGLAVRIIYSPEWPGNISNLEDVFSVLKVVQDWHLEYQNGPLVVVDKFGGTEAATFCALTTLCKELESFNSVDVYQVAKLYHNKRPGIWKSAADLLYLYQAMEALISSNRCNPLHDSSTTTSGVATSIDLSPSSNGTAIGNPWPNGPMKKSLSGHGLASSAATSTTNTTDEEVSNIMTRRYSFPADFKNNQLTNGCAITIPNDEEELTENLAQKSPLLKANSNGV